MQITPLHLIGSGTKIIKIIGTDGYIAVMNSEYRYIQLEQELIKGIQERRWRVGERLPSIRTLCKEQNLSKATVQHALHRLEAQGLVEGRLKAGYFVSPLNTTLETPVERAKIKAPRLASVSDLLLDIMSRSAAFDLLPDLKSGKAPPGIVALNRSIGRSLRYHRSGDYQYYDAPAGNPGLREQLSLHHSRRGWKTSPDELCVTSGCQHALFLALMASCTRGDVVAVESPGFYGVLQLLEQLELRVVEVPSSTVSGMDLDALEEVLSRWNITACILSPSYATPGGSLMTAASKQHILNLADRFDLAIIEDDINAETAFHRVPDPLKALDTDNRVILCSSFSKCLSRDLRLGWVSGARWHDRIVKLKLVTQLASSRYQQRGVAAFMEDGNFSAHLRKQRKELQKQRDQLIGFLSNWSCNLRVSLPEGGLALWVEMPHSVNTMQLYPKALSADVVITPGPLFSVSGQFLNCLRISFAHPWNQQREHALGRLERLIVPE